MPGACCVPPRQEGQLWQCGVVNDPRGCTDVGGTHYYEGWPCEMIQCGATDVFRGACCMPSGECELLTIQACLERGGPFAGPGIYCQEFPCGEPPPPPPDDCQEAGPDQAPTAWLPWDPNLCQNAVFDPAVRPEAHLPDGPSDERGRDDFQPGDFEILSAHPIRAMAQTPTLTGDPCANHYGVVAIDADGDARGVFCSQPKAGRESQRQASYADAYTQTETDPSGLVTAGDVVLRAAYHAPWFTEAQYRSYVVNCEAPT